MKQALRKKTRKSGTKIRSSANSSHEHDTDSVLEVLRQAVRDAEAAGVSRNKIAIAAGINRSRITDLMAGVTPSVVTAEKIAKAVGKKLALIEE